MKRKLYSLALACTLLLAGQTAWADLQQNESGAYLIGSKSDLQAWTEMAGYESTDVVLTNDIEGLDFMLCTNTTSYSGTFDGAGHAITLNYDFQGKQTGMFYNFAGTVKNLIVGGSIRASFKNCAALAAWNWSDNARFENCVSIVSIDVVVLGSGRRIAVAIGHIAYRNACTVHFAYGKDLLVGAERQGDVVRAQRLIPVDAALVAVGLEAEFASCHHVVGDVGAAAWCRSRISILLQAVAIGE